MGDAEEIIPISSNADEELELPEGQIYEDPIDLERSE